MDGEINIVFGLNENLVKRTDAFSTFRVLRDLNLAYGRVLLTSL